VAVDEAGVLKRQFPFLPANIGIDLPGLRYSAFAIDASTRAIDLNRDLLLGYANSSQEGLVLEELTNCESVSTMKAFQVAAVTRGLSDIVEIDADLLSTKRIEDLLPGVRDAIRKSIARVVTEGEPGLPEDQKVTFKARVLRNEVTVGSGGADTNWKGVGYTLTYVTKKLNDDRNGKTVGFVIHDGNASYGGAQTLLQTPVVPRLPTPAAFNPNNEAGDPVNMANGGVYHEETDFDIPNLGTPLAFRRRYDSIHTVSGLTGAPQAWSDRGMGEGWSFTYSDRLEVEADGVTWFTDTGTRLKFTMGGYLFTNPVGVFGVLKGDATTGFTWKDYDGNTTTFGPAVGGGVGGVGGRSPIVSKRDRFGNGVRIDYVPSTTRITKVSDLLNPDRSLTFTYNSDSTPHIQTITDFTTRSWTFSYSSADPLKNGRLQSVTGPAPGNDALAPVVRYDYHTSPDGPSSKAHQGLLWSVTDPSGGKTSWEYYANRRGFRVTDTEALQHSFTYNLFRDQSSFIDERGNVQKFSFDNRGNLLELQQPDRTTERSTWSPEGLKLSATDAYGVPENYEYDPRSGKLTAVVDRSQRRTAINYVGLGVDGFDDADATGLGAIWQPRIGQFRVSNGKAVSSTPNNVSLATIKSFAAVDVRCELDYDISNLLDSPRSAGLIARATADLSAYYLVEALPNVIDFLGYIRPEILVWRVVGNQQTLIGRNGAAIPEGGRLTLEVLGDSITVRVGGRVVLAVNDNTITAAGTVGLRYFGSNAKADNFRAESLRCDVDTITRFNDPSTSDDDVVTKFTYDAAGFMTSRTDDSGANAWNKNAKTVFTPKPDGRGLVDTTTSPQGAVTTFTYNPASQVLSQATRLASGTVVTASASYDDRGNLSWQEDGNGNRTSFTVDALGRKKTETSADPDGPGGPLPSLATTFVYDASGNLTSTTVRDGRATRTVYDSRQRVVSQTAADGTYTLFSYDPAGNKASETDALGRITRYVYDSRNRLVATLLPDGTSTRLRVDGGNRIVASIDQAGSITTTAYDRLGRKTLETLPDPDGAGQLAAPATAWGYDSRGNVKYVTPAFVGQGGVKAGEAAPARSTEFEYDNLGRKKTETQPDPDGAGPLLRPFTSFDYDQDGNLTSVTDPRGFTTIYEYDFLGRKTKETTPDPDGSTGSLVPLVTQFEYDGAGNLRFQIAAGGASRDDVAYTTEHTYDALNRRTATILPDPDGSSLPLARPRTEWTFDASGRPWQTKDARGGVTTTTYRSTDRVFRVTAPDGSAATRTYDAVGNEVLAITGLTIESHGRRTFTSFDAMNRAIAVRSPRPDAQSRTPVTTLVYDVTGNLVQSTDTSTDQLGRTTWKQYDALGRQTAETSPLGSSSGDASATSRTEYDSAGRVTATVDELRRRTVTDYDNLGRKIRTVAPDGGTGLTTHYGYDRAGNLRFTTDPRGASAQDPAFTTWFSYDALGRQTSATDPLSNVSSTVYDTRGRIASTIDALNRKTDYFYDNLGRKVSTIAPDPDGTGLLTNPVTAYAYDPAGNVTSVIRTSLNAALSIGESYGYDALNRRETVTDGLGFQTRTTYDAAGNTTSVSDASGNVTRYSYDRLNRLVKVTEPPTNAANPTPQDTIYAYDLAGNKITETDRRGRVTSFVYDAANRLKEERWQASATDPVFHTIKRFYDDADQLLGVTETDTTNPAAGTAWQYIYDVAGNVTTSRMAPAEIAQPVSTGMIVSAALVQYDFTYDKAGNRLSAAENSGAVAQLSWNNSTAPAARGLGMWTAYTVDALNRVTRYRQLDGTNSDTVTKRVVYTPWADGTIDKIDRYAASGTEAPVGGTANAYDLAGRLTGIRHSPSPVLPPINYGYTYDAAGRIETMTTPEGTNTFTLDASDQLRSASLTGESYAYDKTGNRTSGGTQTDPGNRLAFDGTYRYAYDAEGNRIAKYRDTNPGGALSVGDTDVTFYAYDQRNRLVAVSHVNTWTTAQVAATNTQATSGLPGSDLELRYTYDYADRRIRRAIDPDGTAGIRPETVSFAAYAGDVRTLEIARTASFQGGFFGQVVQRNFYGNGVDEILAVDKIAWNGTTPTTSTFWTFTDHQDSVRDIVSGNAADRGTVVEHRQYDSFGRILSRTTDAFLRTVPTQGVGIDFAYAGRPVEAATGLSDNRARWYEPGTGRFINEDPSGFNGGDVNLYRYVGNDPVNKVDPSGLAAIWTQQAARQSVSAAANGPGLPLTTVVSGVNPLMMTAQAPPASPPTGSLRSRLLAEIEKWPTRGDTGYSAIDAPKALFASLIGNVVAKPAVYFGTYWRHDTMVENTNAIVARNAAINDGRSMSTGSALVQAFAGATTDNIAFGAVGYDPVQNRALDAQERIQRFAGGTAAFTAAFIPVAGAAAVRGLTVGGLVSNVKRNPLNVLDPDFTPNVTTLNRVTAYEFYTTKAGYSPERALAHMDYIDFSRPVTPVTIPYGTTAQQFVGERGPGSYFAPYGSTPLQCGIEPLGQWPTLFQSLGDTPALQSFTRPDFVYPHGVVPGSGAGGGLQYFVPNKRLMVPITR
jgi:RHS repeat-associated protein